MDIEYDGTRYRGWQVQENARSIAGELQRGIRAVGGEMVDMGGSGRTDAGVHALRQTAHLRLRSPVQAESFRNELNDALPHDIHVLSLRAAADRFHARHDAVSRSYLYQIARRRAALAKRYVWWVKRPLDAEAMALAAARLEGRHDFRHFCERPAEQSSTIVVVQRIAVEKAGDLLLVRVEASHFLWKMVRRVVGALVRVGMGALSQEELQRLLNPAGPGDAALQTGVAEWTAPPSGLFLERALYPGEPGLGPLLPAVPVAAPTAFTPFLGAARPD
jgi:tRNA pseudouridine38-40 synthase